MQFERCAAYANRSEPAKLEKELFRRMVPVGNRHPIKAKRVGSRIHKLAGAGKARFEAVFCKFRRHARRNIRRAPERIRKMYNPAPEFRFDVFLGIDGFRDRVAIRQGRQTRMAY